MTTAKNRFQQLLPALLVAPLLWAADGDPEATPAAGDASGASRSDHNREQLIAEQMNPAEVRWLDGQQGKILGLWKRDTSGNPVGAMLILYSPEQPDFTNVVHQLGSYVAHYGWVNLALALPEEDPLSVPARPAPEPAARPSPTPSPSSSPSSSPAPSPAPTPSPAPAATPPPPNNQAESGEPPPKPPLPAAEDAAEARIRAGLDYLNSQGQYNIVIMAYGVNALRAAKFITGMAPPAAKGKRPGGKITRPIRALILVEARNRIAAQAQNLPSYFSDPSLPVLDIFFSDHSFDQTEATERREEARRNQFDTYIQLKLLTPSGLDPAQQDRLSRRVRGFLTRYAKGVEVGKRR